MKRSQLTVVLFLFVFAAQIVSGQTPPPASVPVQPVSRAVEHFPAINFKEIADREKSKPTVPGETDIEEIPAPGPPPPNPRKGGSAASTPSAVKAFSKVIAQSTPSFGTGISPAPVKTFKAEFLSSTTIPPDTMGAVGTTHVVSATNDRMRITTRDGVEISRVTLTSFWAGVTIKSQPVTSAFDPKVFFDRFNNRFILISSANGPNGLPDTGVYSGALFAVSATADPTGTWYRWSVAADPASTTGNGGAGRWIDYPSVGFNKNWIVVNENVFNYTCGTTGTFPCNPTNFWGEQLYVLDKQAAYSNSLASISFFEAAFSGPGCTTAPNPDVALGCGFTMAPAITEDNTTDTVYMVEDWIFNGQLRISKITGTPSAPLFTGGTQFPQGPNAWRFDASRISNRTTATPNGTLITSSGGYVPQRQQSANLPSGTRMAANDSRIQNAVFRNGTLWTAHTVMLSATPQPPAATIGGSGNPVDTHSGIQWWAIDPTNETGGAVAPLQFGRIEDPTADNCHNGVAGTNIIAGRCTSTATQTGEFYAFPNISVNQNNDVFIGFTRFTPLTYPNSAYVIRRAADPVNTTRNVVIFRPGQANYNIGSGASTSTTPSNPSRNNRWGDYSSAQTDPLNDTDFWTVQEYAGTVRDFGIGLAGNWETWWSQISPTGPTPAAGSLIISEFRFRGPQGVRDEFVELYNPGSTPVIVGTTDGSDGWALVNSANGTTVSNVFAVIPNGTVIAPHGHFLVADNPDAANGPTVVYSLNGAACTEARGADSDTGWSLDLVDNGGIALFNTAVTANFSNTTRLDSVGFSSIAAGLFKEGNGIPAVTAATPTGQMTFYRDLSSGTPKDTGANENDFIFANPVVGETLGSTPRLGAAGPENLSSPRNLTGATTLPAALVDSGVGLGDAPNRFRSIGAVTNGAFGTLSFRRTFTNNTGSDLSRLRFRIVDMTTNPPTVNHADLRALTSSSTSVSISGGGTANINGTTVETPPAQTAGGGFNSTFTVPAVTLATPLTAGSSTNLQFALGVQTGGIYNFCLVPESDAAATTSAPLCFAGTTDNLNPQITGGSLSLNAGSSANGTTIATVTDDSDPAGSLVVTATSVPSGITVSNITNAGGAGTASITANVAADCSLATGPYSVTLRVIDSESATNTSTFTVNVTATPVPPTPTIAGTTNGTGTQDQACPEQPLTLTATSAGATSFQWYKDIDLLPGETNSTYQATGAATYYVTATNTCGTSAQSAGYVVQNPTPHSPFVSFRGQDSSVTTLAICQGSSQIIDSDSATGIQWWKDGAPIPGANSQSYTATQAGVYTAQLNALGCHSQFGRDVTITVDAMPPTPTISGDTNGTGTQDQACPEQPLTLHANGATGATSYTWYSDNAVIPNESTSTLVMTGIGNISVTATNGTCTTAHSATYVVQNPTPHSAFLSAAGPTTFCAGGSVTLQSNSATGIQWYLDGNPLPNPNNQNRTVTVGGTYTVILDALGCHSQISNSIVVTVNPLPATPTATPGGPTTFCTPGSVTLTSNSASGNQWYLNGNPIGGATNQTYPATATGSYTVKVTDGNSCTSAASNAVAVTVNPLPATPTITPGGPTTFCAGGSVTLTSSAASGNQWYLNGNPVGGATNTTYVASVAGSYTVKTTDVNSCSSAASAATVVTVNPNPNATITAPASVTTNSTGNVASVANAGAGATYAWGITGGTITAGTGTNSITFTAAAGVGTTTLNVTVTTAAGCSDTKSANVNRVLPVVTVTSVSPNFGTVTGGTSVTVNGTNFVAGATVTFGGTAATNVVVVSAIKITAKTPAHAAGAVNVTVTNTDTSTGTLTNGYMYQAQVFDPNGDGTIDPADIFYLINYLFAGGPAPHGPAGVLSGDANGDGVVDPADIFYLVNYLFLGGQKPNRPGADAITTPHATAVGGGSPEIAGSIALGKPLLRDGHYFVPVVMTSSGSAAPQSMSLKVHVGGDAVGDVIIHRAGAAKDVPTVFETSRRSGNDVSYLVAYDPRGLTFDASRSAVVAEIEIAGADANLTVSIDPALTMLSNQGGTSKATVANGHLAVRGTAASGDSSPRPRTPGHEVN